MQPASNRTGLDTVLLDVSTTDLDPNTTSSPTYIKTNTRVTIPVYFPQITHLEQVELHYLHPAARPVNPLANLKENKYQSRSII